MVNSKKNINFRISYFFDVRDSGSPVSETNISVPPVGVKISNIQANVFSFCSICIYL